MLTWYARARHCTAHSSTVDTPRSTSQHTCTSLMNKLACIKLISNSSDTIWPPGSADTVCPCPPLTTQVQHFVSRIKKRQRWDVQTIWAYDLDLWFWKSPRLSVIYVFVLCQSTKSKFRSMTHTGHTYHVTLWPWRSWRLPLSASSIRTPTLKFLGLTVRKIWHILCVCVSRPVTLTFDLLTLKLVRNVACIMGYPPANFGDTTTIHFRFNTAQTDHVT